MHHAFEPVDRQGDCENERVPSILKKVSFAEVLLQTGIEAERVFPDDLLSTRLESHDRYF